MANRNRQGSGRLGNHLAAGPHSPVERRQGPCVSVRFGRSIRRLVAIVVFTVFVASHIPAATGDDRERRQRFIYNSDGNHMYYYDVPPMTVPQLQRCVDEVADSGVTTFFASPNWGMLPAYPSCVTEMIGSSLTAEQRTQFGEIGGKKVSTERALTNFHAFIESGQDPFGLMIDRARERKLEVFVSYRINEIHDVQNPDSLIVSKFWRDHPQWRVGKPGDKIQPLFAEIIGGSKDHPVHPIVASWFPGALNFAVSEVRDLRLAELRECCERYAIDGIDLDFQRFPIFFPQDQGPQHAGAMTAWVRDVRAMTRAVAKTRGRPLLLSARVMARPEQNLAIGLDPFRWAKEGLVDFLVVSHYLRNDFPLPIAEYRARLPVDMPIYGSIEYEPKPDTYRKIAQQLYRDGTDGVMLFNFFARREGGNKLPLELLDELGDPATIRPVGK